jgi:hypothetical protein
MHPNPHNHNASLHQAQMNYFVMIFQLLLILQGVESMSWGIMGDLGQIGDTLVVSDCLNIVLYFIDLTLIHGQELLILL